MISQLILQNMYNVEYLNVISGVINTNLENPIKTGSIMNDKRV